MNVIQPLRYDRGVETVAEDEQETIARILAAMLRGAELGEKKHGRCLRASHAKSHGLLKGRLEVIADLPRTLRQGLFRQPRTFPVLARLAHVPNELLDDSKVSHPRGFALKVFEVEGPKLPRHKGELTQDFLLNTGKVFLASDPKAFLRQAGIIERVAPQLPQGVKSAISAGSRAANEALGRMGAHSAKLDFFGHPRLHPLSEEYYSQTPFRYGDYVAKMRLRPLSPELLALRQSEFRPRDQNALRGAVVAYFRCQPAVFELAVQLCLDLSSMPVEDAHAEWPEEQSPYEPVARLHFPLQQAYSHARRAHVDEELSFDPAHCLVDHRPLGAINRVRLAVYRRLSSLRRSSNGRLSKEPRHLGEIPD
jgi:hypothetical protein